MLRTYQVIGFDGNDCKVDGTISMDDAGAITYTATPGNKAMMAEFMDEAIPVRDPSKEEGRIRHVPKPGKQEVKSEFRLVTRHTDPALWFEWLPIQYHGSVFYVVPWSPTKPVSERISNLESTRRRKRQGTPKGIRR
jgi:hypothetical protein